MKSFQKQDNSHEDISILNGKQAKNAAKKISKMQYYVFLSKIACLKGGREITHQIQF